MSGETLLLEDSGGDTLAEKVKVNSRELYAKKYIEPKVEKRPETKKNSSDKKAEDATPVSIEA